MKFPPNIRFSVAAMLCFGFLAGCAQQSRTITAYEQPFYALTAGEVFNVGYKAITNKYIEQASMAEVALKGMQGLETIAPSLLVRRQDDVIILERSSAMAASYDAPAEGNVGDWATLTARLIEDGRRVSSDLNDASAEKIYKAVFNGAISGLDKFTRYASADAARFNRSRRDGYGGIGVRFRVWGGLPIIKSVTPNTPAFVAGIKVGDYITHVDDANIAGLNTKQVANKLRGPVNSFVRIVVVRDSASRTMVFEIKRAHIIPRTVTYAFKDGIAIIKLSSFNKKTAKSLRAKLKEALRIHGDDIKGWVLDMRGNPGGLLKQSIKVADLFIAHGDIINTRGRHTNSNQHYEANGKDLALGLPLVVLMDGKSASSAEVVAAALQDQGRAVIIGATSYGKGTVQTVIRLPNNGELTLTWSRLIAPSGYVFHGLGVLPTICTSGESDGALFAVYDPEVRNKTAAAWGQWRHVDFNDKSTRKSLRALCPAERRKGDVEMEVARRLLDDLPLFERTLDFMPLTAQVGTP